MISGFVLIWFPVTSWVDFWLFWIWFWPLWIWLWLRLNLIPATLDLILDTLDLNFGFVLIWFPTMSWFDSRTFMNLVSTFGLDFDYFLVILDLVPNLELAFSLVSFGDLVTAASTSSLVLNWYVFLTNDVHFINRCDSINVVLVPMFNRGCTFRLQPKYHAESTNSNRLLVAINFLFQSCTPNLLNLSFNKDSILNRILKILRSNLNHDPWDNHLFFPSSLGNTYYLCSSLIG